MATDVVMPQMGESIAEGTIVRWIKRVGDAIDKDEPLFEISTDKVDAEIPAPGAGVLLEIKVKEGETVPVNSVVAVIGAAGEKTATPEATGRQRVQGVQRVRRALCPRPRRRRRQRSPNFPNLVNPPNPVNRRRNPRGRLRPRPSPTFVVSGRPRSCGRSRRSTA